MVSGILPDSGGQPLLTVEQDARHHLMITKAMPPEGSSLQSVRAGYDRWALVYDHDVNPLPALEERPMRAAIGDV